MTDMLEFPNSLINIIALRSAVVSEYSLDKEKSAYNDLTDSLRLSLQSFKIE